MFILIIRHIFVAVVLLVLLTLAQVVFILRPFNTKNSDIFCRYISPLCLWILGVKVVLKTDNRPVDAEPRIYLLNHQSNYDLFLSGKIYVNNMVTVGKRELLFIPLFGTAFWLCGHLLINRRNKKQAIQTMDKAEKTIKKKHLSVLVFPEGTRSKGRGLLPFKKGAFVMAKNLQVPLCPIRMSNYVKELNFKKWHSGTVTIEYLPQITLETINKLSVEELMNLAQGLYLHT